MSMLLSKTKILTNIQVNQLFIVALVVTYFYISLCNVTGADIEKGASTPLMEASQEGHIDIVKYLLDRGV